MSEYRNLEVRTDLGEDLKQYILAKFDECHELLTGESNEMEKGNESKRTTENTYQDYLVWQARLSAKRSRRSMRAVQSR